MECVLLAGMQVAVSTKPVSWAEYALFAKDTGRPIPRRTGLRTSPVTGVSAVDAMAFAEWLSQHEGVPYRLPRPEEMEALGRQALGGLGVWPCQSRLRRDSRAGGTGCLTEWLSCLSGQPGQGNPLHCVVHPAWLLREGKKTSRGALADGKYPFVTFRVVCEAGS